MNKDTRTELTKLTEAFCGKNYGCRREIDEFQMRYLEKEAASGNIEAMLLLGEYSREDTEMWYTKAAEAGNTTAMIKLGDYLLEYQSEYKAVMEWYMKALNLGDIRAAAHIGDMYFRCGEAMLEEQPKEKAVRWYQKGAQAQDWLAMIRLGDAYYYGEGIPQYYAEAMHWYQQAVALMETMPYAQYIEDRKLDIHDWDEIPLEQKIATMYRQGLGVQKDYCKAMDWLMKSLNAQEDEWMSIEQAEEKRDWSQLIHIGGWYDTVMDNYDMAKELYREAMNFSGISPCNVAEEIGNAYKYGKGWVDPQFDKALEWYLVALESIDKATEEYGVASRFNRCRETIYRELAELYYDGDATVKQDYQQSVLWLFKLEVLTHRTDTMRCLAIMYNNGWGVEKSYDTAKEWYEKECQAIRDMYSPSESEWGREIANRDVVRRLIDIGSMYEIGEYVEKDSEKADEWFAKAAELGEGDAVLAIAEMYKSGETIPKDFQKALSWYAKLPDSPGVNLRKGDMYYEGDDTLEKDDRRACEYYEALLEDLDAYGIDESIQYVFKRLGNLYYNSRIVLPDYDKAIAYYLKLPYIPEDASLNLAAMYETKGNRQESGRWRRYYKMIHLDA